jgi:hypothetical protein
MAHASKQIDKEICYWDGSSSRAWQEFLIERNVPHSEVLILYK